MILLPNQLFFAEVEAMLSEGREVQIRMKGHSMRPLLRSERDQVVLTPCTDPARLRPGDVVLFSKRPSFIPICGTYCWGVIR